MRIFLYIFTLLFSIPLIYGQSVDEQLANEFLSNGEYDKAAGIYQKLYKKDPNSVYIYENYLNCLLNMENMKEAVSLVEKAKKKNKNALNYVVDLAYVYNYFNEKNKSNAYLSEVKASALSDRNLTMTVSRFLVKRNFMDEATLLLQTGANNFGLDFFWMDLSMMYLRTNDHKAIIDLGIEVIIQNENEENNVYRYISRTLDEPENSEYFRKQALIASQKNPNNEALNSLLLRYFILEKQYSMALRQAISLDSRRKSDGETVMNLANICITNTAFDDAIASLNHILSKGKNNNYYTEARIGVMEVRFLKIKASYNPDAYEVEKLITEINQFLSEYGESPGSANALRWMAELYVYQKNDCKKGIQILEKILNINGMRNTYVGDIKLLLGDVYLMDGDIWEATLLYGQVDKAFKEDVLGQEAKFRNAKLSYFKGDFDWASEQLNILKTATSQLISNNALELALIIQENTGLDTTYEAMTEFSKAEFLLFQNRIDEAMEILNLFPFKFSKHSLEDNIYFLKGRIFEKQKNYEKALKMYETVYTKFRYDLLADNALYESAKLYDKVMKDKNKAFELYEKLLLEFESSFFVTSARQRYRELEKEIKSNS